MMSHRVARLVCREAFARRFPGTDPLIASLQIIQATGLQEGGYGAKWKGFPESNNWGAVISGKKPDAQGNCPEGTFPYGDRGPDGKYNTCFQCYESALDGCLAMLKTMSKTPAEEKALLAGDLDGLSIAMYDAHYYLGTTPSSVDPAERKLIEVGRRSRWIGDGVKIIAQALGEPPYALSPGGSGGNNGSPPSSPGGAGGSGGEALEALAFLGILGIALKSAH
jgi:hypothetical protein